jgi:hypothetical protein
MSLDSFVILRDDRLPSLEEWQRAIDSLGVDISLDSIDNLRKHSGYLPAKFNGLDSGFEWFYGLSAEFFRDTPIDVEDRNYTINFVTRSDMQELMCALFAAGALAKVADGLFYDEENGVFVSGDRAIEIAWGIHDDEQNHARSIAEEDASLTDRRCPECEVPCPSYRKTCKVCGYAIGRAE